jgi:hypothetical protein
MILLFANRRGFRSLFVEAWFARHRRAPHAAAPQIGFGLPHAAWTMIKLRLGAPGLFGFRRFGLVRLIRHALSAPLLAHAITTNASASITFHHEMTSRFVACA